jgi:hypothetical protein
MSIVRLLAAGKSLVGAQNASSRYRMDKRARLPKFGSTKNPFASEQRRPAVTEPAASEAASPRQAAPAPESVARAKEPAASPTPPATARLRQAVRWLRELCVEANPIPRLAGPVRSANTALPSFTGAPIQSELSLDEVKVVRNDLSDADLEIVPAKPVRRAEAAPVPEENSWSRLIPRAGRIFVRAEPD